jgi:hypothetical protein
MLTPQQKQPIFKTFNTIGNANPFFRRGKASLLNQKDIIGDKHLKGGGDDPRIIQSRSQNPAQPSARNPN